MTNRKLKSRKKKHLQTSKLVMFLMITMVFEIILYIEYAMLKIQDLSPAYALIGVSATLVPVIWRYYAKSERENCEGIVYQMAMKENEIDDSEPKG